ncbi:MAG: hypothetical protein KY476_15580 [Planctomycetes bacterium]|nr:hypothetical protein [Planctomycetota bacterium]
MKRLLKGLLMASAIGMAGAAAPAMADEPVPEIGAKLVSYNDLLDRVAELEEKMAEKDAAAASTMMPAPAAGVCCDTGCACESCCDQGGAYFVYENVIVKPYFSQNAAFAIDLDGVATDRHDVEDFEWNLKYSPRLELGYLNCDGMGWRARYWHFDHGTELNAAAANVNGDIEVEIALEPDITIDVAANGTIETRHSLDVYTFDLEAVGRRESCEGGVTGSIGLRYARSEQNYKALDRIATGAVEDIVTSRHFIQGVGPTLSGEVRRQMRGNVSLFANLRGSLLYGESDWVASEDNNPVGSVDDVISIEGSQDLLSIAELQLGVDYRRMTDSGRAVFARVAFETQYWANAGTGLILPASDIDNNDVQAVDPREADLGLLGLTIATGIDW